MPFSRLVARFAGAALLGACLIPAYGATLTVDVPGCSTVALGGTGPNYTLTCTQTAQTCAVNATPASPAGGAVATLTVACSPAAGSVAWQASRDCTTPERRDRQPAARHRQRVRRTQLRLHGHRGRRRPGVRRPSSGPASARAAAPPGQRADRLLDHPHADVRGARRLRRQHLDVRELHGRRHGDVAVVAQERDQPAGRPRRRRRIRSPRTRRRAGHLYLRRDGLRRQRVRERGDHHVHGGGLGPRWASVANIPMSASSTSPGAATSTRSAPIHHPAGHGAGRGAERCPRA